MRKGLELHPSKCQVPNHSWVDWWGWWEAEEENQMERKSDRVVELNQRHNQYTATARTHTHTHLNRN